MTLVTALSFQILSSVSLFGTYFYGGFSSPFLPWLVISLMLGLFYLSKMVGLVIGLFVLNLGVFLTVVSVFGIPNTIPPDELRLLAWLSIVAATIYMTWMALSYSRIMALRSELQIEAERYRTTVKELEHAQQVAEKVSNDRSLFFAKMNHELRTPLNAIIGYSEILMEECADQADVAPQTTKDLSRINSAGKHLLSLVSQVLGSDRAESGELDIDVTAFNLGEFCDDLVATILPTVEQHGNRFVVECPSREDTVQTDRTKLAQILINLLGNAGKFTKGGVIGLTLRVEKAIADDRLIATVSDTGIGIAEENLPKLFDAYIQADASIAGRFGGTGIGLAITRKFCALLGGEIAVTSKPGEGSVFTVDIPSQLTQSDEPEAEAELSPIIAAAA